MTRPHAISQFASETLGIATYRQGFLADPDGNAVTLTIVRDDDGQTVLPPTPANRDDVGLYSYTIGFIQTEQLGTYTVTWSYTMDGEAKQFVSKYLVVEEQPFWDTLNEEQKQLVDNVYHSVSDAFDSTIGGPYLWELPQSTFGYETIARLMCVDAITYINLAKPKPFIPPFNVGADVPNPFPPAWYGLLERVTQWHLYRHLATSYLEQPDPQGVSTAYLDRQRYHDKWLAMSDLVKRETDEMLVGLKRQYLYGVYARSMLIAGGLFPLRYFNPSRPRWPYVMARF